MMYMYVYVSAQSTTVTAVSSRVDHSVGDITSFALSSVLQNACEMLVNDNKINEKSLVVLPVIPDVTNKTYKCTFITCLDTEFLLT